MSDRVSGEPVAAREPLIASLPKRIVVGANGAYWRDFGDSYSMCPVSTDNDPVEVVAVYKRVESPERLHDEVRPCGLGPHAPGHTWFLHDRRMWCPGV